MWNSIPFEINESRTLESFVSKSLKLMKKDTYV